MTMDDDVRVYPLLIIKELWGRRTRDATAFPRLFARRPIAGDAGLVGGITRRPGRTSA